MWDLSGNELTRNSSGNTRSQSSQLAEPLWTDPGLKSGMHFKKKKERKRRPGMNCRTFSQNPRKRGKGHHHHQQRLLLLLYILTCFTMTYCRHYLQPLTAQCCSVLLSAAQCGLDCCTDYDCSLLNEGQLILLRVPVGSPSRGRDVTVYVFNTDQPSLPTPFYSVLVSISLLWPF